MDFLPFVIVGIAIALLTVFVIGAKRRPANPPETSTNEPSVEAAPTKPERTEATVVLPAKELTLSAKHEERLARLLKTRGWNGARSQLPALPPFFVGRRSELAQAFALLDGPDPPRALAIVAARGLAGVGRSGFSAALAHLLAERYPDAQLFLDLRGDEKRGTPRGVSDAMCHVMHSLNPGAQPPRDPGAIPVSYRRALEGKRILLLIENIRLQPYIELLIPPENSLLLLTSREALGIAGVAAIPLEPFSRPEARAFLRASGSRVTREPDKHLDLLAELSGYLPAALRINAGWIQSNPGQPIDSHFDSLKKADAFQRPIEAAVSAGLPALPEDARQTLHLLAAVSDSFDAGDAAAVCELNEDAARKHLDALNAAGLICVVERGEPLRFVFGECARLLVSQSEDDADHANLRLTRHRAALPAEGNRRSIEAAWKWTRGFVQRFQFRNEDDFSPAETPEPFAAPARVSSASYSDALRLLMDFPNSQTSIREISWLEAAVSAARALGDRASEGRALAALGKARLRSGEARPAVACFEEWVEIARGVGDRHNEAEALGWLGSGWTKAGFADRGTGCFEAQLAIARETGDRTSEAHVLEKLGSAKSSLGDFQSAAVLHGEQLRIAREIADRASEASGLENLGIVWTRLDDLAKAATFHEEQLRVAREIGDRVAEIRALGFLGHTALHRGEIDAAFTHHNEQLRIARDCGDRNAESHAHASLGVAWARQGDVRKAVAHYEEQLLISQQIGDRLGEATTYSKIGTGLESVGDPAGAAAAWEKALAIYESLGSPSAEPMRRWLERVRKTLADGGART